MNPHTNGIFELDLIDKSCHKIFDVQYSYQWELQFEHEHIYFKKMFFIGFLMHLVLWLGWWILFLCWYALCHLSFCFLYYSCSSIVIPFAFFCRFPLRCAFSCISYSWNYSVVIFFSIIYQYALSYVFFSFNFVLHLFFCLIDICYDYICWSLLASPFIVDIP